MSTTHDAMVTLLCSGWEVEAAAPGCLPSLVNRATAKPRLSHYLGLGDIPAIASDRAKHCFHGHRLSKTNVYTWTDGKYKHRRCRKCNQAYQAYYRAKMRG